MGEGSSFAYFDVWRTSPSGCRATKSQGSEQVDDGGLTLGTVGMGSSVLFETRHKEDHLSKNEPIL
jgi:hypothetical protein